MVACRKNKGGRQIFDIWGGINLASLVLEMGYLLTLSHYVRVIPPPVHIHILGFCRGGGVMVNSPPPRAVFWRCWEDCPQRPLLLVTIGHNMPALVLTVAYSDFIPPPLPTREPFSQLNQRQTLADSIRHHGDWPSLRTGPPHAIYARELGDWESGGWGQHHKALEQGGGESMGVLCRGGKSRCISITYISPCYRLVHIIEQLF